MKVQWVGIGFLLSWLTGSLFATPSISQQPKTLYLEEGRLAVFSVSTTNNSGTLSYVWIKDSVAATNNAHVFGSNLRQLSICPVRAGDEGAYWVIVSDDTGSATSSVARLIYDFPLPKILSGPADLQVANGSSASFSISATNALAYQWFLDATPLTNGTHYSGVDSPTLQINGATQNDNGLYGVRLTNERGAVNSRFARLRVALNNVLASALDNETVLYDNPGGWLVQTNRTSDGVDAAESPDIEDGESASCSARFYGPGEISFQWAVSSEQTYDNLIYYLDGKEQERISGERGWAEVALPILGEQHTVSWTYRKDSSKSAGSDSAFLDALAFRPIPFGSGLEAAIDGLATPLVQGGEGFWTGQSDTTHDGVDAARIPNLEDDEIAWFETTVMGPGRVSFWVRTSSESYDKFRFRIDGAEQIAIGGDTGWRAVTNWVDWRSHTLRWEYRKDGSNSYNEDTVWVDEVSFEPSPLPLPGEALDAPGLAWETGGDSAWFGQVGFTSDGTDALQSGIIGDSGQSWIKTTVNGPGTLYFQWKTSSEPSYDYLRFFVNGSEIAKKSGDSDWSEYSIEITNIAPVDLVWKYTKDGSSADFEDAAWLDQVHFITPSNAFYLTVKESPHGTPNPPPGTYQLNPGTVITCSVESVVSAESSQYECAGWSGSGSVPATGNSNAVVFTLLDNSTLDWNWKTNHWLEVSSVGNGSVDPSSGWYPQGSEQHLSATPDAGWLFMEWGGDASGTNAQTAIVLSSPKTVSATFSDDADGDGLSNTQEEELGSDPRSSDTDGDSLPDLWEYNYFASATNAAPADDSDADRSDNRSEYIAGTDPTNAASCLHIVSGTLTNNGEQIRIEWTPSVEGRIYGISWAGSLQEEFQPLEGESPYPETSIVLTNSSSKGFYKVNTRLSE